MDENQGPHEETRLNLFVLEFPPLLGILLTPSFFSCVYVCSPESPKSRVWPIPATWVIPNNPGVNIARSGPFWPVCPVLSLASWSCGDPSALGRGWPSAPPVLGLSAVLPKPGLLEEIVTIYPSAALAERMGHHWQTFHPVLPVWSPVRNCIIFGVQHTRKFCRNPLALPENAKC